MDRRDCGEVGKKAGHAPRLASGTSEGQPCVLCLLANAKSLDQIRVAFGILTLHIVEEASPLADEFQKPAARVVIFGVDLEVFGQIADPLAQDRHLHLGGTSIGVVGAIRPDDFRLPLLEQCQLFASAHDPDTPRMNHWPMRYQTAATL